MRRWQSTVGLAISAAMCAARSGPVAADGGPAAVATGLPAAGDDTPVPAPFVDAPLPADSPVRKSFDRLADPDPAVRDDAEYDLMGMDPHDLPGLRLLVRDRRSTLTPGQVAALHEVFVQVDLAAMPYTAIGAPADPDHDTPELFLGIRSEPGIGIDDPHLGVYVGMRYPGFPSYRVLRDGDVILNAIVDPRVGPAIVPNAQTYSFNQLVKVIRWAALKHLPITLVVLRDGREIRRAVTLAPRPFEASENEGWERANTFLAERSNRAEKDWQEQFDPLVTDDPAGSITAD